MTVGKPGEEVGAYYDALARRLFEVYSAGDSPMRIAMGDIRAKTTNYKLGPTGHGLVGFAADGSVKVTTPGHAFGSTAEAARAELEAQAAKLLE